MTSEYGMRASDRDRERALEVLRRAYAAGRLDLTEFHERTGAACAARTWGSLRTATADLPEAQVLLRGGTDAGYHGNAGGSDRAVRRPFLPMVLMAVIWLSIAAVGHVAAAIPLVLLSMFILATAYWNTGPSWQPQARATQPDAQAWQPQAPAMPPGAQAVPPARPGGSTRPAVVVPADRDVNAKAAMRHCSLPARRRSRCHRGG